MRRTWQYGTAPPWPQDSTLMGSVQVTSTPMYYMYCRFQRAVLRERPESPRQDGDRVGRGLNGTVELEDPEDWLPMEQ